MDTRKSIGVYLQTIRIGRGLTQDELAALLGTSSRNISRWESGANEIGLFTLLDLLNIIRGSAGDLQRIAAEDIDEDGAIALAHRHIEQNKGTITIEHVRSRFEQE